ncbi:MAG: putative Ig domain-containing protein [Pirellulales bacterium]
MTETVLGSLDSFPPSSAAINSVYQYQPQVPVVDHPLEFSLLEAPSGMTVNSESGLLTWTPSPTQLGKQSVILRAQNELGEFTDQAFVVTVDPVAGIAGEGDHDDDDDEDDETGAGNVAPPGATAIYFLSVTNPGYLQNSNKTRLFVDDSDIVKLNLYANGSWFYELYLDGSDVGLSTGTEDVDGFAIRSNGDLLISTSGLVQVPGVNASGEDILVFRPQSLGSTTRGSWQLYVDGSDLGLSNWEGLDDFEELPDGRLLISTDRTASVNGLSDVRSEDILALTITSTGENTVGTFQYYFDGSDVALTSNSSQENANEDVNAIAVRSNGDLLLSTSGKFQVPNLNGDGSDVFAFRSSRLGTTTAGTYLSPLVVDGSRLSMGCNGIDALEIGVVNQPPVIAAITPKAINELAAWQLQFTASDTDTPQSSLRWAVVSAPSGVSINNITGKLSWTPTEAQGPGSYPIVVSVSDGSNVVQSTVNVTVTEVNQLPVVTAVGRQFVDELATLSVQIIVTDSDLPAQILSYSLGATAPIGATITSTGLLNWTPSETDGSRDFSIPVIVTDSLGGSATITVPVTVREVNQPPVVAAVSRRAIDELATLSVQISATDPDIPTQTLSYALGASAPTGATISSTGLFRWKPTEADGPGDFSIPVIVSDSAGGSKTVTIPVTVREVNQLPIVNTVGSQIVDELSPFTIQISASDADLPAQSLSYSLGTTAPVGATISSTGLVTWTPAEADGPGIFSIPVTVTDSLGGSNTVTIPVTVREVNRPPVIDPITNQSIAVNSTLQVTARGTDPDLPANTLTYSLQTGPANASINPQTGLVTWTPSQSGTYLFTVKVSDNGGLSATQSFNVIVSGGSGVQLNEQTRFITAATQTLTLLNNQSALRVQFTAPTFDTTSFGSMRDAFEIEVTDQAGNLLALPWATGARASFNWTEGLAPVNSAAVNLTNVGSDYTALIDLAGLAANTAVVAHLRLVNNDSDNGTSVNISNVDFVASTTPRPTGMQFTNAASSSEAVPDLSGFQDLSSSIVSNYAHSSIVDDQPIITSELSLTNQSSQTITGRLLAVVENLSDPGVKLLQPSGFLTDGRPYIDLTENIVGHSLAPGQSTLPRLLSFSNDSGVRFTFKVSAFGEVNSAPKGFSTVPLLQIEAGKIYRYSAQAADEQSLVYSKLSGPTAMQVNALTGEISWPTQSGDIGQQSVTIRATDPFGLYVEQSFDIQVLTSLQNRPPLFVSSPGTEATAASGFEVVTVPIGKTPTGLAVGDFGSNQTSLVAINQGDQSLSYVAGLGNEQYADTRTLSVGEPRPSVDVVRTSINVDLGLKPYLHPNDQNYIDAFASSDFNGDGNLDSVAVVRQFNSDVNGNQVVQRLFIVSLGNGDGTFQSPVTTSLPFQFSYDSGLMLSTDLDRDGQTDLLLLDRYISNQNQLFFIKGHGDGTFATPSLLNLTNPIVHMRLADFDADGKQDLLVQQVQSSVLGLLRGHGDGTFAAQSNIFTFPSGGFQTDSYSAGDIDGDQDLDVAIADWGRSRIIVLKNQGNGIFDQSADLFSKQPGSAANNPTASNPSAVLIGDFTKDGKADIVYGTYNASVNGFYGGGIATYVGDGTGTQFTYQESQNNRIPYRPLADANTTPIDIDRDGDLDLLLTSRGPNYNNSQGVVVGLNDGTGKFNLVNYIDSGSGVDQQNSGPNRAVATGAVVGDFNNDSMLDVLMVGSNQIFSADYSRLSVLLADRPGVFRTATTVPVEQAAFGSVSFLMTGDFNNDGKPDVWGQQYQGVSVTRLGNGDGTFQPGFTATPYIGNESIAAGFVADLNNDGNLDVMWTGLGGVQGGPAPRLLAALGNGDGTFQISYSRTAVGKAIAPGDFNKDGLIDFAARGDNSFYIMLNDPAQPGTFIQSAFTALAPLGSDSSAITVGDFNSDSKLDVAVVLTDGNRPPHRLQIYFGNGDGTTGPANTTSILADSDLTFPKWMSAEDLNHDGFADLVVTASYSRLAVLLGKGDGTFGKPMTYVGGTFFANSGTDILLRDVNGDGNLDLVGFDDNAGNGRLMVRLGVGDGSFSQQLAYDNSSNTATLASADFDNDGRQDFVLMNLSNYAEASIFTGTRPGLTDVVSVDSNGDSNLDILAINNDNGHVKRLIGNGQGEFVRQPDLLVGAGPVALATGDLNSDGRMDFVTANRADKSLSVMLATNSNSYQRNDISLDAIPLDIQIADINNDGKLDIAIADTFHRTLQILVGTGLGTFNPAVQIPLGDMPGFGDMPGSLTLKDVSGDGKLDGVIALPNSQRIMLLIGTGTGSFAAPTYIALDSMPQAIDAGDLNQDGIADLTVTLPNTDQLAVFFGIGGNRFAQPQKIRVGEKPNSVRLQDANKDGRLDILVTNSGDSTASIILNKYDPTKIYNYQAQATDPDNDPVSFSLIAGPGGMIFDPATGQMHWAPSADQVGTQQVILRATDGRGGISDQRFNIEVSNSSDNAAPVFTSISAPTVAADQSFTYSAHAVDDNNDRLRYTLVSGPQGATIDPTTGLVEWDARSGALQFNPARTQGSVSIPNSPSLQLSSMTIEGWFSFDATSNQGLIWKETPGAYPFFGASYALRYQFGNLQAIIGDGSFAGEAIASIPWTPTFGQAYHLAASFDETTGLLSLLVNGAVVAQKTTSSRIGNFDLPLTLGNTTSTDSFRGTMSDVRIWNIARTPAQIKAGMDLQFAPTTSNLVADYRFNEIGTLSIIDSTGNQLNGKLAGDFLPRHVVGIAPASTASFTISAEDGKGGIDVQTFQVQVVSRLRGDLTGRVFADSNRDGTQQSSELALSGASVFLDLNGNATRDADEPSSTSDSLGNYQFVNLTSGNYTVRVQTKAGYLDGTAKLVAIASLQTSTADLGVAPQNAGQLRGTVRDDRSVLAAHMQVFADLDRDGFLDSNEPTSWTDDAGEYVLAGLNAGSYSVRVASRPGWTTTAPASGAIDAALTTGGSVNSLNFTVKPQNEQSRNAPVFVSTPNTQAVARTVFSDWAFAYDPQNAAISYSLAVAPTGMAIDPVSGHIVLLPSVSQIGSQRVIVLATNASGSTALQDYLIEVGTPNSAPLVTSQPSSPIVAGKLFSYYVEAQDGEQSSFIYSLVSGPNGASINGSTGEFTWTPTAADVGNHAVNLAISDGFGGVTQHAFVLTVQAAQVATTPFVISTPRADASLQISYVSRTGGLDAQGQPLRTELLNGPSGLTLSSNGLLQWSPSLNQLGPATLAVRYHSPSGPTQDQQFTITVRQVVSNSSPIIQSQPVLFSTVGQPYTYNLSIVDADYDAIAYELVTAPSGMSINHTNGTIRWTPVADQKGLSTVLVRVHDAQGAFAEQSFQILTRGQSSTPTITSVPSTEAIVGRTYLYSVRADDSENDPLVFSLLQSPNGMSINSRTGEVAWTPTSGQVGQQTVIISVSDGLGGSSTQGFAILVRAGAPNVASEFTTTPPVLASVGTAYSYQASATDPEGSALIYSLRTAPQGMTINAQSGLIGWTPIQSGRFVVTLVATDSLGAAAVQSFELDVLATNHAPVFISPNTTSIYAGSKLNFEVVARDSDFDPINYRIVSGAPSGMSIDALGRITWSTTAVNVGNYAIVLAATDPRGGTASQTLNLQVLADTTPPKVTVLPTPGGWPWDGPIVVFVSAVDNVGVTNLELRVNNQLVALDSYHMARLYAEDWGFGTLNMTATATDAAGNSGSGAAASFYRNPDIDFATNPSLPTAVVTSPQADATVTGLVQIIGTAAGAEFKEYRLSYARTDQTNFTEIVHSTTAVTNGLLGTWDTSLLENDAYIIRLEVTDIVGSTNVVDTTVGLSGGLKLGNFRLSFEDMTIPVAGIPITIARTYDTLRADRDGDFGYGWRLEFRDTDLRTSLPKSGLEDIGIYTPFKQGTKVYLTLPGGERQGFTFTPEYRVLPGFGKGNDLVIAFPRFTADRGFTSTLSAGGGSLIVNEFGELMASGNVPWNPASPDFGGYTLTTRSGMKYRVDGSTGLMTSVSDVSGNQLDFSASGVENRSTGQAIRFDRDVNGRVTRVTDPLGKSVQYEYSASGDLAAVTDRDQNRTTFQYLSSRAHYLDKIVDPLGRDGVRAVYGIDGRLSSVVNANGNATTASYDPNNSLVTTRDALGAATVFEYDNFGNVISTKDPLNQFTRNFYDDQGRLVGTTDPLGRTTRYMLDVNGNIVETIDPTGASTRLTVDVNGNILSRTDPMGRTSTNRYDDHGRIIEQTDASGRRSTFEYNSRGLITHQVSADGLATTLGYDAQGRPTQVTQSDGSFSVNSFDANNRVTSELTTFKNRNGVQSVELHYQYDNSGNLRGVTGPDGSSSWQLDGNGNLSASVDPLGRSTQFTYAPNGDVTSVLLPNNRTIQSLLNANGQTTQVTNSDGTVANYQYDAAGQTTAFTLNGGTTTREYDAAGQLVATVDPIGVRVSRTYDAAGRLTSLSNVLGTYATLAYDASGAPIQFTDGTGRNLFYTYDASGRVTAVRDDLGRTSTIEYDSLGNKSRVVGADGMSWSFKFDAGGLLVSATDSGGGITRFTHDQQGKLDGIIDSLGRTTALVFDAAGRQIERTLPGGQKQTAQYDSVGRLIKLVGFDGQITTYTYNDGDKLATRTGRDGTESFLYDSSSRVIQISGPAGTTNFTYNANGQIASIAEQGDPAVQFTYDAAGNVKTVSSAGYTATHSLDTVGRLNQISSTLGDQVSVSRDLIGRVVSESINNQLTVSRSYDAVGQIQSITYTNASSAVIFGLNYTRNSKGQITQIAESTGRVQSYEYDQFGRLIYETSTFGSSTTSIGYTYDSAGNLLSRTTGGITTGFVVNSNDQLVSVGNTPFTNDANGNRTSAGQNTYRYDDQNRLIEVVMANGTRVSYRYSSDGLLRERNLNGQITKFVWDRSAALPVLLQELDSSNNVIRQYQSDGSQIVLIREGSVSRYLLIDQFGTVRGQYANGVTTLNEIDGFGNYRSNQPNLIGMSNQWTDPVTGFVFMRSRWYDPSTARFLTMDSHPVSPEDPQTINRYAFSSNDPINNFDPTGQFTQSEFTTVQFITSVLAFSMFSISFGAAIRGGGLQYGFGVGSVFDVSEFSGAMFGVSLSFGIAATIGGGLEAVSFKSNWFDVNLYLVIGASFAIPSSESLVSPGVYFGSVFDTPEPRNYEGWFWSITFGANIVSVAAALTGNPIPQTPTAYVNVAWSPTKTYDHPKTGKPRFSHTYAFVPGGSFGIAVSYYMLVGSYDLKYDNGDFQMRDIVSLLRGFEGKTT